MVKSKKTIEDKPDPEIMKDTRKNKEDDAAAAAGLKRTKPNFNRVYDSPMERGKKNGYNSEEEESAASGSDVESNNAVSPVVKKVILWSSDEEESPPPRRMTAEDMFDALIGKKKNTPLSINEQKKIDEISSDFGDTLSSKKSKSTSSGEETFTIKKPTKPETKTKRDKPLPNSEEDSAASGPVFKKIIVSSSDEEESSPPKHMTAEDMFDAIIGKKDTPLRTTSEAMFDTLIEKKENTPLLINQQKKIDKIPSDSGDTFSSTKSKSKSTSIDVAGKKTTKHEPKTKRGKSKKPRQIKKKSSDEMTLKETNGRKRKNDSSDEDFNFRAEESKMKSDSDQEELAQERKILRSSRGIARIKYVFDDDSY